MKETNDLWELVQTLTKSEKRYIQMEFRPGSLQEELFKAIGKQDEYDQEGLYKAFPKESPTHIRAMQQYLLKTIFKRLRSFYSGASADILLNEYLTEVEILFNKGLIRQCFKTLEKGKKIAYDYERYEHLDRFITFEERLNFVVSDFKKAKDYFTQYKEECRLLREKLDNIGSTRELFHRVYTITKNIGYSRNLNDRDKLKDIIEKHPLLQTPDTLKSLRAKSNYYLTKIFYSHSVGQFQECYKYSKEYAELTRKQSNLMPEEYAVLMVPPLHNLILCQAHLKKYDELEQTLKEFRSLEAKAFSIENRIFSVSYSIELDMDVSTGQFERIDNIIDEINTGLTKYRRVVDKETYRAICYNTAYMYFGIAKYDKAMHWINKILNDAGEEKREDIYCFAQIIKLIMLFEMEDEDYMDSILRSTYRYLFKRQRLYKFETIVLKFIQRQLSLRKKPDMKAELEDIYKTLQTLFEDPHERVVLEYFNFMAWLESKITRRTFGEIVKENARTALMKRA